VSALWLWSSDQARAAVATGDIAVIIRAYRAVTGTSQRQLAALLGYDPTYISMIETGRRGINDVATLRRIARCLGLPPRSLGIGEVDDADFASLLQFGESTVRLAVVARQSGHGVEAVNELWPLVARLEARVADGRTEHGVLLLLARARAELGVSLGYVLPEERLVSAARWTGRALVLAEHLDDRELLAFTLRVHGNELRKVDRPTAGTARLHRSAKLARERDRTLVLLQLARATGELGQPVPFDSILNTARRLVDENCHGVASPYALHEVHLRGLVRTGRARQAARLLDQPQGRTDAVPPQWQAMLHVTTGEVLLANGDADEAEAAFRRAVLVAESYRLPHQIQRVVRATGGRLPAARESAHAALERLVAPRIS
jgi:transcriptional regulator with XRE-family HTH domain